MSIHLIEKTQFHVQAIVVRDLFLPKVTYF
jgi:hypothetical protein